MTMTKYQAELLVELRDAKRIRDESGWSNPIADALLERCEQGEFGALGNGPDEFGTVSEVGRAPEAGARAGNQYGSAVVKMASDAQVRYIASLMRNKDLSGLGNRAAEVVEKARPHIEAGKINKKHASRVLDVLVPLDDKPKPAAMAGDPNANRRPNRFGGKCVNCGVYVQAEAGWLTKTAAGKWASEHKSGECPAPDSVAVVAARKVWTVEDSGIYRDPATGTIWKVYCAVHGSRNMCAKVLETRVNFEKSDHPVFMIGEFQYRGLAERFVKPEWLMSIEDAKALGRIYGFCCVCGATLTDEESISEGIGPVCGGRRKRSGVQFAWAG